MSESVSYPLNKGYTGLLDADDADLAQYNWTVQLLPTGVAYAYRSIKVDGKWSHACMHRIILSRKLGIELTSDQRCDHRDRNGLNNTRGNLRLATAAQNSQNNLPGRNNTSGVRGVWWRKDTQKWQAEIKVEKKCQYLGVYTDFNDAVAARLEAELKYFGEFSPLKGSALESKTAAFATV